ncbi:hypothetical protein C5472_02170 [Photorhabdus sp. RW14-46]|nr:hypothetical protein PluDJC_00685 [Photorhabdus laumondii subsp. laumondii]AXG45480.1 hypothetical protein PluTT01m_00630 [Photorhabdus laumondii subsp. laumondii]MCZ1248738.1 hypothetical protein [Photorhabdus laumondii subsp. laumondii]NHB60006.1 hypothetical protein [Photorhabdus sp. RW14-46]
MFLCVMMNDNRLKSYSIKSPAYAGVFLGEMECCLVYARCNQEIFFTFLQKNFLKDEYRTVIYSKGKHNLPHIFDKNNY